MKNLYLLLLLLTLFACSSDDDSSTTESFTKTELLVNGSVWNFENAEIVSVQTNNLDLSNSELLNITEQRTFPSSFDFKNNGTVLIVSDGNEITADYSILDNSIILTAQDDSTLDLESVEITENQFSWDFKFEEAGGDYGETVTIWTAKLNYN